MSYSSPGEYFRNPRIMCARSRTRDSPSGRTKLLRGAL